MNSRLTHILNYLFISTLLVCQATYAFAQYDVYIGRGPFTKADSLRGMLNEHRSCFDVTHYDLNLRIEPASKSISGYNQITYTSIATHKRIQLDLFDNLLIDSIIWQGNSLKFERFGHALFVDFPEQIALSKVVEIRVYYHGEPIVAVKPPWDGGFVWSKDSAGKPWVGVACEGLGASAWWPLKDHLSDEPDSQRVVLTVPNGLMAVSNGRLRSQRSEPDGYQTYEWAVTSPINSYNVSLYIADYVHISDVYDGESGPLSLDYYVLRQNQAKAKPHFAAQVPKMLECFEKYFGPYPFYQDGYKLVETDYWGMEHQSAIAYGNSFTVNKYGFDYIIVHETGHEWFGNRISVPDHAEMWIHEAFTTYSEALYMECLHGKEKSIQYLLDQQGFIGNLDAVLAPLGVNFSDWKNSDMYYKGSWMLHTLRSLIDDDVLFFKAIKGLLPAFYDRMATTEEVIDYLNEALMVDFTPFYHHFLMVAAKPKFVYQLRVRGGQGYEMAYRVDSPVNGMVLPIQFTDAQGEIHQLVAQNDWQRCLVPINNPKQLKFNKSVGYYGYEYLGEGNKGFAKP